jgi:hypothetical protein
MPRYSLTIKGLFVLTFLTLSVCGTYLLADDQKSQVSLPEVAPEQLLFMEFESPATLTKTDPRLVPAAVTTITNEQIQASRATSLCSPAAKCRRSEFGSSTKYDDRQASKEQLATQTTIIVEKR